MIIKKFGRPVLYQDTDIAGVMEQFKPVDYYKRVCPVPVCHSDDEGEESLAQHKNGEVVVKFL